MALGIPTQGELEGSTNRANNFRAEGADPTQQNISMEELLLAAGDGRDEENAIAFLEGTGFPAEEADVFFVEIDVEELANLALIIADVAREIREPGGKFVQSLGDGRGATVKFCRAVGESPERCGDFDGHRHFSFSLRNVPLSSGASSRGAELRVEVRLESVKARRDGFRNREFGGDGVGGFQTVASDADDGSFIGLDAILRDEFLRHGGRDATCRFREDTFGFGQQLDGTNNFRVGNIFGPAAGFANQLDGIGPVCRIADRQWGSDGIWLFRVEGGGIKRHTV